LSCNNEIELFIVDLFCLCLIFLVVFGVHMLFVLRVCALFFGAAAGAARARYNLQRPLEQALLAAQKLASLVL
jgi:hypothetical protein